MKGGDLTNVSFEDKNSTNTALGAGKSNFFNFVTESTLHKTLALFSTNPEFQTDAEKKAKKLQEEILKIVDSLKMKIDDLAWVQDTLFLVDFNKFDLHKIDVSKIDEEVSEFVSRVEEYDKPLNNKNGLDDTLIEESSKYTVQGICQLSNLQFRELASSKTDSESFIVFLGRNDTASIALQFEELLPELSFNRFGNSVVQSLIGGEPEVK